MKEEQVTYTRSDIEKMYDRAYKHGAGHIIHLFKVCAKYGQSLTEAIQQIEKITTKNPTNEPPTTSDPGQVNDLA